MPYILYSNTHITQTFKHLYPFVKFGIFFTQACIIAFHFHVHRSMNRNISTKLCILVADFQKRIEHFTAIEIESEHKFDTNLFSTPLLY